MTARGTGDGAAVPGVLLLGFPRHGDRLERLAAAAVAAGLAPRIAAPDEVAVVLRDGRATVLGAAGVPLRPAGVLHTLWAARVAGAALDALAGGGAVVLNGSAPTALAADKHATSVALAAAGLPQLPCALAHGGAADLAAAEALGWPVVVKRLDGSGGTSVFLARDAAALGAATAVVRERAPGLPVLLQAYAAEAAGRDLRAFVVGDRVVAAMERRATADGEFRANLAQGGAAVPADLAPGEAAAAVRATRALGLDYAGVDLVRTEAGPLVLEVNGEPNTAGIEAACGPVVAPAIVALLVARLARGA